MAPPASMPAAPLDGPELRKRLDYDDARLLAECAVDLYKASGPGGQHRNKVTSAVRLRHRLSGLHATATESRSQHENRARALARLRRAIALSARAPLPPRVQWPETVHVADGRLRVNEKNPAFDHVIALALDALADYRGQLKAAAAHLRLTTSSLVRFLYEHPPAWRQANHIRQQLGLRPLQPPR